MVAIGGTGNVGQPIIRGLIEKQFDVLVVSRDTKKAKELFGDKVKYAELADYSDIGKVTKVLEGYEVLICSLSSRSGALKSQDDLIKAAKAAHIKRFIPSEWAWEKSEAFIKDEKMKIRKLIEASGMEWTYFNVGYFSEYIWSSWFGFDIPKREFNVVGSKDSKISHTDLVTIGKYAAAFINDPSSKNATVEFATETLTYGEAFEKLEKLLGTKLTPKYTSPSVHKEIFEKDGKTEATLFDQLKYDIGVGNVVIKNSQHTKFPEIKGLTFEQFAAKQK